MKKLTIALAAGLLTLSASSLANQPNLVEAVTSADSQSLRQYLTSMDGFTAQFAQTVYDEQQQVLQQSSGNLAIKRPGMLRWQVEVPDEELLIANGDALWLFSPFLEQVSIYDLQQAIGQTPFMLLTSDDAEVWNNYQISKNQSGYRITPVAMSNVAWLQVNIKANAIESILMQDSAGKLTQFQLSEFTVNNGLENSLFQFKIPAGVDVDDQRVAG